jgi:hypothetical protein
MSSLLVFYSIYRLEIQSVMLVFSTPLVKQRRSNLCHWFTYPSSPLPCVNKYRGIVHTYSVYRVGGGGIGGLSQTPAAKYIYW